LDGRLVLARATHLHDYIAVLRDIGAPVDRDLARSLLPPHIEETPDLYVNVPVALEWLARTGHDLHPMELGLFGAQKASLTSLRPSHQVAILSAQTGLKRLEALAAVAQFEDSTLEVCIQDEGDNVRVSCTTLGLDGHLFVCFAEWLNLQSVISIVRSVVGESWCPGEIGFISELNLPQNVHAEFPNTRVLLGQPRTSVVVSRADLARATCGPDHPTGSAIAPLCPDDPQSAWEFVSLLRMMVQPYLNEGRTDIGFVAELVRVSTRTLQRRLKLSGSSYSQIVQEARFDLARRRLDDGDMKVIDVAMMVGYESPQHFTRAFRRFTGVTPSQYRNQSFREAS
jgi:AraC-like DNA-binding protein